MQIRGFNNHPFIRQSSVLDDYVYTKSPEAEHPKKSRQFLCLKSAFFFIEYLLQIYCILSLEFSSKCSSVWFAAVLNMPSPHVDNWAGRSCFHCQDQEEIRIIVAINWKTAGHKSRK